MKGRVTMRCGNCKQHHASAAEVKKCYANRNLPSGVMPGVKQEELGWAPRSPIPAHLRPDTSMASTRDWSAPTYAGDRVMDGIYAVVLPDDPKGQVTLRFHVLTMGPRKGTQVVDYLSGPDNESDWERFANVVDGGYRVFNRFLTAERMTNALVFLMKADRDTLISAGEGYALRSGRCWRCFRLLTVEESIVRGMGPVCAAKLDVA